MSSFIRSSEVVHDSAAVVSGITLIGMDSGRDSEKEKKKRKDKGEDVIKLSLNNQSHRDCLFSE